MIYLKDFLNESDDKDKEYSIHELGNPNGWNWKDLDILIGMGFDADGDTRLKLSVKNKTGYEMNINASIYKNKRGYVLELNNKKYVFRSFPQMMEKIDEFGTINI